MASVPGLLAMPTVLIHSLLSLLPDRTLAVRSPDTLAVILPMFNEERGAEQALASVLTQDHMPDRVLVSINGGTDGTYQAVFRTLNRFGYRARGVEHHSGLDAAIAIWRSGEAAPQVVVVRYRDQTAKSRSINNAIREGLVSADRYLLVDGDTVLAPGFIAALRDHFYRLTMGRTRRGRTLVLEDFGLQSGAVMAASPAGSSLSRKLISRGRRAEYAFSGVVRRGQAKMFGRGGITAASRLYTVIGCGFSARHDLFPMPETTMTEDHDFTLESQTQPHDLTHLSPPELAARGFRLVVRGEERSPEEFLDRDDVIVVRRGGNARFVGNALMNTEGPPHLAGYFNQVERWNGGALQNLLQRLRRRLPANVLYATWAAQLENVLGLLLLGVAPLLLGLNLGNPSLGWPLEALFAWLVADIALTLVLTGYGFLLYWRAVGLSPPAALGRSLFDALASLLPFLLLKYLNPVTYLAAASSVLPAAGRSASKATAAAGTWIRPVHSRRTRTGFILMALLVIGGSLSGIAVLVAPGLRPINRDAWDLVHQSAQIDLATYATMPIPVVEAQSLQPQRMGRPEPAPIRPGSTPKAVAKGDSPRALQAAVPRVSRFCALPETTLSEGSLQRLEGDPRRYAPLGRGHLLTLARLAPLLAYLEGAASFYRVPPGTLLQVLLNESYLDPLAIGPTGDLGLSQMTGDALTLLRGLSLDSRSGFHNPRLFPEAFSVFDPDFSICAGAAKLAWAFSRPEVEDERQAYAIYINPVNGFVGDHVAEGLEGPIAAMAALEPMVLAISDAVALFREDPGAVSRQEGVLLGIAESVARGELSLQQAYERTLDVVRQEGIPDQDMYQAVLESLFPRTASSAKGLPFSERRAGGCCR